MQSPTPAALISITAFNCRLSFSSLSLLSLAGFNEREFRPAERRTRHEDQKEEKIAAEANGPRFLVKVSLHSPFRRKMNKLHAEKRQQLILEEEVVRVREKKPLSVVLCSHRL
jgi:hypothetical protein